ncbi:DUF3592 domain-containing protein [Microcoleus sp. herbarium2]|uniref:DUF3592 domain-containing protein n=1 Tax=Microcoleus sp. herbarium2 TaxID=3055433 RepID=UPI002FD6F399
MNLPALKKHKDNTNNWFGKLFFFILLPGFLWALAGWMYVTIPDRYRTEVDFRARAVRTSGIVTKKNQKTTCYGGYGCSSSCDVTVKFQTNRGKTIVFSNSCTSANENQTVPVLYDPNSSPVKARIDIEDSPESRRINNFIWSFIVFLFGLGSLITGFSIYRKKHTQD